MTKHNCLNKRRNTLVITMKQDRLCKSCQVQANACKQGHPDATKEEIKAKYPSVVVPRKKTKREIEASQKHEGESEEHFAKHLQNTEQKQQQRVALKCMFFLYYRHQLLALLERIILNHVPVPVLPSPLIDLVLLGPQPHPTPSCCIQPLHKLYFLICLKRVLIYFRRHTQESLILEDTNKYIIFMHAPFPLDVELNNIIMDHLVHHQSIKLEGFCMPEVVKQLTAEYMATHWNVQPARVVEVHDGLADPRQSEKILDVSMTHQGVLPPFRWQDDSHYWGTWKQTMGKTDKQLGVSFTLILLLGDIYIYSFQPPGAVHAVYTPEASFTQGAFFWSLDTIHTGLWSTKLDYTLKQVYKGLMWMMLFLPTNPDKYKHSQTYSLGPP
ncbi:hypothetical protein EDD18DRAFT_1113872 [Armillaria luteobubalina]|uniref:Uncharacterized protein n=1 Tax=Armillaria luteobubalina TaxID=153913 RepID=A0AA39P8P7_9AGAR|nr:hypothetical protein EDD18DRAFT_1113872 [Armillaria luteobubalina]